MKYITFNSACSYAAGPMLQSARWFNLYLHPPGFHMEKRAVPAEEVRVFREHIEPPCRTCWGRKN